MAHKIKENLEEDLAILRKQSADPVDIRASSKAGWNKAFWDPIASISTTASPSEVQADPAVEILSGTGPSLRPDLLDTALRDVNASQIPNAVEALLSCGVEEASVGTTQETYGTRLESVLD